MLNQVVLVGRLAREIKVSKYKGSEKASIMLAIPRSYKNENGEYDTDFIRVELWNNIATNTAEYCKKGDIVGIKGRLQCNCPERTTTYVIAEKVTFLSSRGGNDDDNS